MTWGDHGTSTLETQFVTPSTYKCGCARQDIQAGRAALKPVPAAPAPAADAPEADSLEARLREGLARFRLGLDETASTAAGDDTAAFTP